METWRPFGQFPVGVIDVEWLGDNTITPSQVDPTAVSRNTHTDLVQFVWSPS